MENEKEKKIGIKCSRKEFPREFTEAPCLLCDDGILTSSV